MKTKTIFSIFFGIFMIFFSCKESGNEEEAIILPVPKIKTVTYYNNNAVEHIDSFEHDSLGRCIKLTTVTVSTDDTRYTRSNTYQYTPDKVLVNRIYDEMNHYTRDTIFLNEQGLQVRTSQVSQNWEYDLNGYLVLRKSSVPGSMPEEYSFRVADGNTVEVINTLKGTTEDKIFYTMYLTFIPNSVNTIGIENKGFYIHGKQDKNLVKEYHTDIIYRNPADYRNSYLYEYDAKKRVTKRIAIGSPVQSYEIYTYYE